MLAIIIMQERASNLNSEFQGLGRIAAGGMANGYSLWKKITPNTNTGDNQRIHWAKIFSYVSNMQDT